MLNSIVSHDFSLLVTVLLVACVVGTFSYCIYRQYIRVPKRSKESREIALLQYRVEELSKGSDTNSTNYMCAEQQGLLLLDPVEDNESDKLNGAITAAKHGATSKQISDCFGLIDSESELIVSVHGLSSTSSSKMLH